MERCSNPKMLQLMKLVNEMKRNGIEFVPIPVISDSDREYLQRDYQSRMDVLILEAEKTGDVFEDVSRETYENMVETEAVMMIQKFLSGREIISINKTKGNVFAFCSMNNGSEMVKVPFDPWPNSESATMKVKNG